MVAEAAQKITPSRGHSQRACKGRVWAICHNSPKFATTRSSSNASTQLLVDFVSLVQQRGFRQLPPKLAASPQAQDNTATKWSQKLGLMLQHCEQQESFFKSDSHGLIAS